MIRLDRDEGEGEDEGKGEAGERCLRMLCEVIVNKSLEGRGELNGGR